MVEHDIKEKYILQRDEFKKNKANLLEKISEHASEIKKLEKQIRDFRPRTEKGKFICDYCDTVSLEYLGRTPQGGAAGGDDIYECEICGRDKL